MGRRGSGVRLGRGMIRAEGGEWVVQIVMLFVE